MRFPGRLDMKKWSKEKSGFKEGKMVSEQFSMKRVFLFWHLGSLGCLQIFSHCLLCQTALC